MYSYESYSRVKETLAKRRQDAIDLAESRNVALRGQSKEISEIDSELTKTGFLLFKTAVSGGDVNKIKERNLALGKRRKEIIVSLGYPEDYTEVKFTCAKCNDTGYIDTRMCECLKKELVLEGVRNSGMGNLIEKQCFESFDIDWYKDNEKNLKRMQSNLLVAKEFSKDFGKHSKNLLLIGPTGTGKTHISTAIAKCVIEKGYEVLYDSCQNIVSAFEYDRFKSGYDREEPRGQKYLECDLLILDDLGTEFVNEFTRSCLYNLFNTRQNRGLSTIISTNLLPDELSQKYDGRITSRITGSDYTILAFGGRDHRVY